MSEKQISATMGGFTPSFDCVVQDVGIIGAAVFGRVWRYCQGYRGVCDASIATIAETLRLSTRTVLRWIKELCDLGYLEDVTPDLRNKPHTYRDTGKVSLQVNIVAMTESPPAMTESHSTMTESHSHYDRESLEETCKRQTKREAPSPAGALPATSTSAPVEKITCKHPSIQIFKEKAHQYPKTALYSEIATAVGDDPSDLAFWGEVVYGCMRKWGNPHNVSCMLDHYARGEIPDGGRREGNGHALEDTGPPVVVYGINRVPEWIGGNGGPV